MKRCAFAASVSLGLLVSIALSTQPLTAAPSQPIARTRLAPSATRPQWRPGEVIVKFRGAVGRPSAARVHAALGARVARRIPGAAAELVKLPAGTSVLDAVEAYSSNPLVAFAEPNLLVYPSAHDTQYVHQWGLNNTGQSHPLAGSGNTASGTPGADIDAPEAWNAGYTGSSDTVVAVLDSGVDVNHVDLNDNLWTNPGEIAGNGIDDDANGKIDDVYGWDFAGNDSSLIETDTALEGYDHGTHVAGIVAAEHDGAGITGVCPGCKIMVLKFMAPYDCYGNIPGDDCVIGDLAAELAAIAYAKQEGADIINGSFGRTIYFSRSERSAVASAGRAEILFVASAGNQNGDNDLFASYDLDGDGDVDSEGPAYPASYNLGSIVAVAASNHHDELGYDTTCASAYGGPGFPCSFSNWGNQAVDVAAPGVDVLSTVPGNAYDTWNGTSMAAPMVAGVAGLVESAHPTYTPVQIKNAIMNSADKPASLRDLYAFSRAGIDGPITGTWMRAGRVDAAAAINAPITNATPVNDGNINGARAITTSRKGSVKWPGDTNDVVKKKLYKNNTYRAVLNGPNIKTKDLDLIIMDPGTTDIWQYDVACELSGFGASACKVTKWPFDEDSDTTIKFKAPKTGIYYFHVADYAGAGGSYTLTVKKV